MTEIAYELVSPEATSKNVLYVSAGIKINASADHVFECLLRIGRWSEWNSFCPAATLRSVRVDTAEVDQVIVKGSKIAVQVKMTPSSTLRTQNMLVTELDRAARKACWKAEGMPEFMLRTSRTSECLPSTAGDDAVCEFRTFEMMNGPTAYVVRQMYGEVLQERFKDMATDLKNYAEKTWLRDNA